MADRKSEKRAVMTQLAVSSRVVRTALSARLAAQGLYPGQDALLLMLGEEDGLALRDLALRLAVRPPTITKTIARLAAQGFVEKRASASDARQSFVHLTAEGRALVEEVRLAQHETERQAMRGLKGKDRKALRKLLAKVERNFAPDTASAHDDGASDEA